MTILGAFYGGGNKTVPAGKCLLHLSINTIDRLNLGTASWTVTATGKSFTATADSTGRADLLVDSGLTYTVTLTHQGSYYNDDPQTVAATSTGVVWVYFDLFQYPDIKTVVQVISKPGSTVTATSGSNTMTKMANSAGLAEFDGLATASVWTFTVNNESKTITIDRLLTTIEVGNTMIFGVRVAKSTSSPDSRCVYINDCAGYTPFVNNSGSFSPGSWDGNELIKDIKPVAKSGSTWTDLDKRSLSGCPTSTAGDAFVEVPTWWLSWTCDSNYHYIRFSNKKVDDTYQKFASMYEGKDVGMFHYGLFDMIVSSSKGYSYSGATPTVNMSITNFITYAQARGDGYDLATFYQTMYLTALMVLLFKSTDGQSAVGKGYTSGSSVQSRSKLTFGNDYGMAGSKTSGTTPMAFFWIHDFWGNIYDFIGGAKTNSSCKLMTITDGKSSVDEAKFTQRATTISSSSSGWVSDVEGTPEAGPFPKAFSGSSSTFWCDLGYVLASDFPSFGGCYRYGDSAGPFLWYFYYSATETYSYVGSRLSYRAGRA